MQTDPTQTTPLTVAVIGGTGTAGAATVAELRRRGHTVRPLSRRGTGAEHVDLADPATFPAAFSEVEVLVDAVNTNQPKEAQVLMVDQLGAALQSAAEAGVGHVVSLGIIGAERVPNAYYRAKVEQEAVVRASPIPSTIVRATQFHELVAHWAEAATRFGAMFLPRGAMQPVDVREVAAVVADAVEARESGAVRTIAGPEVEPIAALGRAFSGGRDAGRRIVTLPAVGGMLRAVADGALTDPAAPRGSVSFSQWLAEQRPA